MMKKLILLISISTLINGCFAGLNSCIDPETGSQCVTVESNLQYTEERNNSVKNDNRSLQGFDNLSTRNSDSDVFQDEFIRLMTLQSISVNNTTRAPTVVQPGSYRVLILPYTDKGKLYSSRYVYITAGKPRWVSGNFIISENTPIKVNVPEATYEAKEVLEIDDRLALSKVENLPQNDAITNQYKVNSPNGLNCRSRPTTNSEILATWEDGKYLNVIDDSSKWFKVNMYKAICYVNSYYIVNEYEK